MKPNILMTPQFKQAFKLLKKKHQNNILKDIIKVIEQLVNFEITTQKSNHPLSDGINDLHIRGDVILLYKYQGAGLIIDLNLLNISDHKELQKNLKLAKKDIANIPFDLEKEKKNLREEKFETPSQGQILKRGDLSEYKISDEELEAVRNKDIMENKENLLNREEVKEFNNIFKKFLKEVSKNLKKAGFSNEFISNMNNTTTTKNAWIGWRGDKDPGGIIWEFKFKLSDYDLNYKDIEGKIYPVIKKSIENIKNSLAPNFSIKEWGIDSGISNVDKVVLSFDIYNYVEEHHVKTDSIDDEEKLNIPNKQEILDWFSEDKENWEDFINYFGKIYDPITKIDIDELLYWIEYHDLDRQFQTKFGIPTYAIPYEDRTSGEDLEEIKNREIVESMQDKKYIVFDHFNPDTLYFVKNIPDNSWIWDSDWIIEDVTDKHGNCLIENNDEYISVGEMGDKTLSDFDKEIIASLKKAIQEDPDEEYLCAYTSEDREFCFEKDELPDDLDSMKPFTDFVEDSYIDGDSSSQYQVINLDTEEFGEFGVEIFASDWEDLEESVDNSVELSTAIYDPSDGTYIISKKDWEDWD